MIISRTGKDILSNPANYSSTDDLCEVSELGATDTCTPAECKIGFVVIFTPHSGLACLTQLLINLSQEGSAVP